MSYITRNTKSTLLTTQFVKYRKQICEEHHAHVPVQCKMSYHLLALVRASELTVCYSGHSFLCYARIFAYTNDTAVNSSTCNYHRQHNHSSSSSCEDRGPRDDRLYADSMSSESVERTGRESRLGWELKQVTSSHLQNRSSSRRCMMGLSTTLTPTMTPRTNTNDVI